MALFQRRVSRRHIGIVAGLVVIALVIFAVQQISGRTPPATGPAALVPVTAAIATRSDVPNTLSAIGTVQSTDSVAVQPRVSGAIVKVEFTPGQDVTKGQELFLIDPRPYQAVVDQAQAQLAHDEAVLEEAQVDLTRYQTLVQQNSIAKQQAQDQVYVVAQDKGTVELDQANLETAKLNLEYCHVAAPISGRAGALLIDLGNLVGPQSGQAGAAGTSGTGTAAAANAGGGAASSASLVSIAQLKPIHVNFTVPQTMLGEIIRNQAAGEREVDAYSQAGKLIEKGKLTLIDNQINTATGTVLLQGTFANDDEALWPGEFVRAKLFISTRKNVVTVPTTALMTGPDGLYVYVIGADGKVKRVAVEVAARSTTISVIAKGLAAGDKVVTDGQTRLANGTKVEVRQSAAAG